MINEAHIVPYQSKDLPVEQGPWIVFAPHADDESFGMGGALAKAVDAGIKVELVVMTDGSLGGSQDNLVAKRKAEAIEAASILGLEQPVFFAHKDRELKLDDSTLAQVVGEIERVDPAAVFFPGVFELHPDHRTTAALIWQALRRVARKDLVPVSYEVLVQSPINTLVDITAFVEKKKSAMSAYQSQLDENRYMDIALALNQLRTLTLDSMVSHAEGFYCFEPGDVSEELVDIVVGKIHSFFI